MMIKHRQFNQKTKLIDDTEKIKFSPIDQAGFTIIESLVAILVISILMAGIAPIIAISVATRVQARRLELASQAARTYIDGVRAGTIVAPNYVVTLSEVSSSNTFTPNRSTFAGVSAPSSTLSSCSGTGYCTNTTSSSIYCIDRDQSSCANTSVQDLVIQAYRSQASTSSTTDQGYVLAVRVYKANSFQSGVQLKAMKDSTNNAYVYKANPFVGGLGDPVSPLVEFTTEITTSNTAFQDYCTRFGGCQ